jgi:uncharacterized protein
MTSSRRLVLSCILHAALLFAFACDNPSEKQTRKPVSASPAPPAQVLVDNALTTNSVPSVPTVIPTTPSPTQRLIQRDKNAKIFVQPLPREKNTVPTEPELTAEITASLKASDSQEALMQKVVAAARERTTHHVIYDPAYIQLNYPGGDVAPGKGVCTDVIIRVYRTLGIDLQKEVHEDMKAHFAKYPTRWGRSETDSNIDHRRVQNLMTYFERHGETLEVTDNPDDYKPGDIVTWQLSAGMHIGIVVDNKAPGADHYMVVHNIGRGPKMDDFLFVRPITGHYRYYGPDKHKVTPVTSSQ